MSSPADQAQTGHRGGRASGRSPLLSATSTGVPAPGQKKGGKKAGQPTSNTQQRSQNLQETKKKGKMKLNKSTDEDIVSQLQRLDLRRGDGVATGTALVYDDRLADFHCLWDKNFPECPARLTAVKEKLAQYGLTQRCIPVQAREAVDEEILLVHSPEYLDRMKSTQSMSEEELRAMSADYDSVYLHPRSYSSACLAGGSVLQLVDKVFAGEVRNGMAVVRPPGHHAQWEKMNGYCMFNNIAMAARYAQQEHGASRILIVDWDVHHGQGTQYMFEDDPSVLYFSIHRYEQGHFWPHLPESDSHAVGKGRGEGFTINVPWNKIGMGDADYITAFLQLLLPIAHEFQPHLVLVAAGFDSVVGDPKGEMAASPACFAHLTHLLMPLAGGKLILALEGGYNLRSLAEGSCSALKILLGDPCPRLASPVVPCQSALTSISETIGSHYKYWKSLRHYGEVDEMQAEAVEEQEGGPSPEELEAALDTAMAEVMRALPPERTGLVYDERMMEHFNAWDSHHPELPQRISRIYQRHVELQLVERCSRLPARHATEDELQMCHSTNYIQTISSTADMKPRDLHRQGCEYNSIFINPKSYDSARLATGGTFSAVEAVMTGKVQNAVAIVRPPGHHAERDTACGFCFFNTAALAARYAQRIAGRMLKVMILDWDVHHGNGTQHIFEDDPSVLYVSIHRYDQATFFPSSTDADYDQVGCGSGAGFNVNIPWNNSKMGDAEYLMAFHRAIMPIAYEFNPDLVLVSAGFDAARGDPLGGCLVSPEGYAHMTHLLMGLAGGRIVVVLEGGYNLSSISESMSMCTRTLLGDPLPDLGKLRTPQRSAQQSVSSTIRAHRKYWKSLQLTVPEFVVAEEAVVDHPVSPNKVPGRTSKPSTPEGKSSSSLVQQTTPVGTGKNQDLKQAEKPRLPMSPSGKPETSMVMEDDSDTKLTEMQCVPLSPLGKSETQRVAEDDHRGANAGESRISSLTLPDTIVSFETDHEVEKPLEARDPMSPLGKPLSPMEVENDLEVNKAGESRVSVSLSGTPETTLFEKDHELEKAVETRVPISPLRKPVTPIMIEKERALGEAAESVSASPLGRPETNPTTEKDHEVENGVLSVPMSPLGKPDKSEETRSDPEKDPSVALSIPEETVTHVVSRKDPFEVCPAEIGVPQLILQGSDTLVGECADSEAVLTVEIRGSESPIKVVDHEQVSVTEMLVSQSVVRQPIIQVETKNELEEPCLTTLLPARPSEEMLPEDLGKDQPVDQTVLCCLPVGEPTTPVGIRKDPCDALTADMKALRVCAGEPVPMEQIFHLEQMSLRDGHRNSLVSSKDSTGDRSPQQSSAGSTLPLSAYQSPTSVPVGGARRKVKSCMTFSDSPTTAGPASPTLASSSSSASANSASPAASLSDSPGQTFSTAPTTPVFRSPVAPVPTSLALAPSALSAAQSPSLPVLASQGSAISGNVVDAQPMLDHENGCSGDSVVEVSLALQVVDVAGESQKESPGPSANTSPKKGELLEEASGWTNPLTSRTLCQLFGNYPEEESGTMYAVTPLPWCPHLESVQPVPASGLNLEDPCRDCGGAIENWVCLVCYEVYCGRYINEHMMMHGLTSGHMVVLSYADLSVWCYSCESYVHNEALSVAKNAAHRVKFGEDVA